MKNRETFFCWIFGQQALGVFIRANCAKDARDLAAFRLRSPRHLVAVRRDSNLSAIL